MLKLYLNGKPVSHIVHFNRFKQKAAQGIKKNVSNIFFNFATLYLMSRFKFESFILTLFLTLGTMWDSFRGIRSIHSIQSLNSLIQNAKEKKEKNALFIVAHSDTTGIIDIENPGWATAYNFSFLSSLAKTHNLVIHRVGSIKELKNAMRNNPPSSFDTLVIDAHGNPNAIALNESGNYLFDKDLKENAPNSLAKKVCDKLISYFKMPYQFLEVVTPSDFQALKKDGRIILLSCSTGRGKKPIAKKISKLAKARYVFAPKIPITDSGVTIDKRSRIKMRAPFSAKDHTAVFKDGKAVVPAFAY